MRIASSDMPIGIFDSGVGGLTVMKEIIEKLPHENIIYMGDTARVPYGIRSSDTVRRYSLENAHFLLSKGVKLLVVACNTSSAVSLDLLREKLAIPVIGVVEPGAKAAVKITVRKKVAVIGTETTIRSGSYERAIRAIDGSIRVSGYTCPLFVPIIEEGWLDGDIVNLTAQKYLSSVKNDGFDTVVLGCTHYPMIKNIIESIVEVPLIDSAVETAKEVKRVLESENIHRQENMEASRRFFVTDSPEKFAQIGKRFFGHEIPNITKIDLEKYQLTI